VDDSNQNAGCVSPKAHKSSKFITWTNKNLAKNILPTNVAKIIIPRTRHDIPGFTAKSFKITANATTSAAYVIEKTTPGSSVVTPSISSDSASTTSNGTRSNQSPTNKASTPMVQQDNFDVAAEPTKTNWDEIPQQSTTTATDTSSKTVSSRSRVNASVAKEFCTWVEPANKIISRIDSRIQIFTNKITGSKNDVLHENESMQNTVSKATGNHARKLLAG
jgi:hypothetical protein